MEAYLDLLHEIMDDGEVRKGRNGNTKSLFALQFRHDMRDGFPAITTKELKFKSVVSELLWFISGSRDERELRKLNGTEKSIWTANAEDPKWKEKAEFEGDVGRIYGVQWRHWITGPYTYVDQLQTTIDGIRTNPFDRRHVVTAWNPSELHKMCLPPCHMLFQFYCTSDGGISLHMVQRSCDMFLGVPWNIASYGLLLEMVALVTGRSAKDLVITFNDAHIYEEHYEAVLEQLKRSPLPLPFLRLNREVTQIDQFKMDDIGLFDYEHHPAIKAKMVL